MHDEMRKYKSIYVCDIKILEAVYNMFPRQNIQKTKNSFAFKKCTKNDYALLLFTILDELHVLPFPNHSLALIPSTDQFLEYR